MKCVSFKLDVELVVPDDFEVRDFDDKKNEDKTPFFFQGKELDIFLSLEESFKMKDKKLSGFVDSFVVTQPKVRDLR